MNNRNPYKVPQGYFASLEESILQKTIYAKDSTVIEAKVGDIRGGAFSQKQNSEAPVLEPLKKSLDIAPHLDITPQNEEQKPRGIRSLMGFAAGFAVMVLLAWGGFSLMIGQDSVEPTIEESELVAEVADDFDIEEVLLMNIDEYELIDMLFDANDNSIIVAQDIVEYMSMYEDIDAMDFENL